MYYFGVMRLNSLLMLSLLAIVITAPIVDAIACDDCSYVSPLRNMQQKITTGAGLSGENLLTSDGGRSAPQGTGTAQDLCPVCANIAAAMDSACCGAPSMVSQTNPLPKPIALSGPSYSITKPPQN